MNEERRPTPAEEAKRLYEESETRTAKAFEQLVARDSFGELLARATENVVAITRIGTDAFDLVLRNLRLAGRQDIVRLSRQLARTEDKLERVLQEVESLRDEQGSRAGAVNGATQSRSGAAASRSSGRRGSRSGGGRGGAGGGSQ